MCQVLLAFAYIFATLYDDGTQPQFYQSQCGKQSAGSGAHNNYLWLVFHLIIYSTFVFIIRRHFIEVYPHFQVDEDGALPGVYAPFQYAERGYITQVQPFLLRKICLELLLVGGNFREDS